MDDDTVTDQRAPHIKEGAPPVTPATLRALGVLAWKVPPATPAGAARLAAIRKARGYSYQDTIEVSPAKLPGYGQKIKSFYEEHVHTDEEIRYVLAGSGYFDVRGAGDEWIRILVKEGDLIVLPEGIYHRFTLDTANHIVVNRLFVGEPVWTAHNRPQEEGAARESRARYVAAFLGGSVAV
jgi:1,2-dihydroxy-3-keto-5-methylthiopentene dioxygenase